MNQTDHFENLSFEVVIPSCVLLCPRLDSSHVRLFSFVKGLTKAHGYCYASNAHLGKLCGLSSRQITRLISKLEEEGFLEVDTDKTGIHWQRRIYLGGGLNKVLRRDMHVPPPSRSCPTPSTYMSNRIKIVKEKIVKGGGEEKIQNATPPCSKIKIPEKELKRLYKLYGERSVVKYVLKLQRYADSRPDRFDLYGSHAAVIEQWMEDDKVPMEQLSEEDRLIEAKRRRGSIEILKDPE